jgi:hypothetical protein
MVFMHACRAFPLVYKHSSPPTITPFPPTTMRKATTIIFLMAVALTVIATTTPPTIRRRSRFLANKLSPPLYYECRKEPPSLCKNLKSETLI